MELYAPGLSASRDPIFCDSRDPMIIFSNFGDPIFNSSDPKGFLKHSKNLYLALVTNRCYVRM